MTLPNAAMPHLHLTLTLPPQPRSLSLSRIAGRTRTPPLSLSLSRSQSDGNADGGRISFRLSLRPRPAAALLSLRTAQSLKAEEYGVGLEDQVASGGINSTGTRTGGSGGGINSTSNEAAAGVANIGGGGGSGADMGGKGGSASGDAGDGSGGDDQNPGPGDWWANLWFAMKVWFIGAIRRIMTRKNLVEAIPLFAMAFTYWKVFFCPNVETPEVKEKWERMKRYMDVVLPGSKVVRSVLTPKNE